MSAFAESDWRPHPEGHPGNFALPLIAVGGDPNDDGVKGEMRATPHLARCSALRQLLAAFEAPIGRTRLMRIDGNAEATAHVDVNYYWQTRVRVHVPIVTDPAVRFLCGDRELHMAPGETWIFDTWRLHNVINPNPTRRIHLVADTAGSPRLRALIDEGWDPFSGAPAPEATTIAFDEARSAEPRMEVHNFPVVMAPAEQHALFEIFAADLDASAAGRALRDEVVRFLDAWQSLWRMHEAAPRGWRAYAELLELTEQRIARHLGAWMLPNGIDAAQAVQQILLRPALNTDLARRTAPSIARSRNAFDRPIFIVSSPRSGSSLLFETLAQAPEVMTIGGESHALIEGIGALHPAAHGWESNRLTAPDASESVADDLRARFASAAVDRDGRAPATHRFRFLEKTPKNALRIPFLRALFADAFFIYLYRDERATISSMLDAWRSGRFITYPDLPGWEGQPWSLLLTPGWRDTIGRPLAEVVARQWIAATTVVLDDLEMLPPESWCVASYDALIEQPQETMERLCDYVGLRWDRTLTAPLPPSRHTLTPPDAAKWQRNATELAPLLPLIEPAAARARDLFASAPRQRTMPASAARAPAANPTSADAPPQNATDFRSVHTTNFPRLLAELRISLAVSTYQSGRVVLLRADGERLNTHFRFFASPMGLAFDGTRLAIGTLGEIWDYRNVPSAAARLHPARHDACFLPRNMHVTGDIRVHELAFADDGELWLVNTRFSALCTLDSEHSFLPRWRPPFISKLAAEDRCHLNGLAIVDGVPRYATALGATDTAEGWRERKASGGIVIDIPTGELVATGLAMPHSPRLYNGQAYILESAAGTLATLDLRSGRRETIAQLPGFTRGLAFAGPIAFVGLSQVRERVFDNIPLGERLRADERSCGIWAIDVRSGAIVAFVRFEGSVQEIFDIQVLPGIVFPDLLEPGADLAQSSFVLSDDAIAQT
ncbi:MAG: TIGR03032 family protein [Acidobacteria bacterium]|nr:TIGR03032 family protein [Acidobacteriota bacterium]MBV9476242.1 TIGR03032 family protein [Acidobacteriota bacterium]